MKSGRGYAGKILHVDLTSKNLWTEEPSEEWYRLYWGGSVVGIYYALKLIPPGVDPLGPENVLIFAISPLTGVPVAGNSRLTVTALSPLTGTIGDSQSGGFLPAEMKFAGFDAVIIRGRAPSPVYLWIHDGETELRPADHIWGQVTGDTEDLIREELRDRQVKIAEIGPAGEKLVRFAAIMHMANRANGRTGLGAVMGSKNLKAIAVRGHRSPKVADPESIRSLIKNTKGKIENSRWAQSLHSYGTAALVKYQNSISGLPTNNYPNRYFPDADAISGERMKETILKDMETCFACPIACKPVVKVEDGPWKVDPRYGGPEYETIAAFGSYCGVNDLEAIAKANELCAKYGVDTISCGSAVAWAMEAYQNEFIKKKLDGSSEQLHPRFGDSASMLKLTTLILTREGIGDLLAEGVDRAAAKIGPEAEALLLTINKHNNPAHISQLKRSFGLAHTMNHLNDSRNLSAHSANYRFGLKQARLEQLAGFEFTAPLATEALSEEKVRIALMAQYFYSALDALNVCQFVFGVGAEPFGPDELLTFARATTGWDVTMDELMDLGARRVSMMKIFNKRQGVRAKDNKLLKRMFMVLSGIPTNGKRLSQKELSEAIKRYYWIAGWDENGIPKPETLQKLGLGWLSRAIVTSDSSPHNDENSQRGEEEA